MAVSIVCGVDGSEGASAGVLWAGRVAERLGARLVIAHVVEPPPSFPDGHELLAERRQRRRDETAEAIFDRVEAHAPRVSLERRVRDGPTVEGLREITREENGALIVVGARGRGPAKTALLGSVSSALARGSDRPVTVIPPDAARAVTSQTAEARRVAVCGVDGSPEAERAVAVAGQLSAALELELLLVNVYRRDAVATSVAAPGAVPPPTDPASEERRRAALAVAEDAASPVPEGVPVRTRAEAGEPAAAVDRTTMEERATMIVVGSRGRGNIASALLGSTSSRLTATATRPVVVVPAEASLNLGESS